MAYVEDDHDPSGLGMFSKAGRYTTEKYIIFQKKDEILYNQKNFSKTESMYTLPKESVVVEENAFENESHKKESKSRDKVEGSNRIDEKMPFSKELSREEANKILTEKDFTKPVGHYEPKYSEIDRSVHLVWNFEDIQKNHHFVRGIRSLTTKTIESDKNYETVSPDKIKSKILGFVDYGRELDRDHIIEFVKNDPHESRFEPINYSEEWSNLKKIPLIFFKTSLGRDDLKNQLYKAKEHQPDYSPNYEFGKKNLGEAVPEFIKVPPRKPYYKSECKENTHTYDYDYYVKNSKSNVFKSVPLININKMEPRAIDPNSPLPSFMQKHVNERETLTSLHYKMLEENHFFDGRFESTRSEFDNIEESNRKEKSEEVSEQNIAEQDEEFEELETKNDIIQIENKE